MLKAEKETLITIILLLTVTDESLNAWYCKFTIIRENFIFTDIREFDHSRI